MGVQINGDTGNISATKADYSGNVTIGGTLTYEDVTNIDSVGLITARTGIEIGARPGVAASVSVDGNAIFSGITTVGGDVKVGSGVTLSPDGNIFATGISTFGGDIKTSGSNIILGDSGGSNDDRIKLGAGADLQLYHDGNNSVLEDSGTGSLIAKASTFHVKSTGGEDILKGITDGAVELYHDNSKKFETTSTGISVTGSVSVTTEPAFRAGLINNTTAVASATSYNVPFDTDSGDGVFDTNGCFDTSTHRFTPNLAGYYLIHLQVRFTLAASSHIFQARIRNSSDIIIAIANKSSTGAFNDTASVSCLQYFNGSSDYVFAQVYQNSGNSVDINGGTPYHYQTFFEGHFVRSA